jgi:hypothetical protein
VLAGRFGRRRLVIDASQVAAIVPHEQQVFLKPGATIVGSEPASGPRERAANPPMPDQGNT